VQRAVSRAHRETGAPITVHTNSIYQTGRIALDLYRKEGVDLTKVVVGHAGDSNDLDYLKWLMDQGATIGCDRFGLEMRNPTVKRVETIATLCAQGYADRIVLGHDHACFVDCFPRVEDQQAIAELEPDWHFRHITTNVVPALLEHGVTVEQVELMLVDNPRRYFTGSEN
jgi:phosphotriesterase-related protein